MSGAEAGTVLGIISSIISIVQATQQIYSAVTDAHGIPEAFRAVAETTPLVLIILHDCQRVQERVRQEHARSVDAQYRHELEQATSAAQSILRSCEGSANKLKQIFDKVIPGDDAGWLERYRSAARAVKPGRKTKVEDLIKEILQQLQLLHISRFFKQELQREGELQSALDRLQELPPSLPDDEGQFLHTGTGSMNVLTGSGRQQNYSITGGTNSKMYNAESMSFGKD